MALSHDSIKKLNVELANPKNLTELLKEIILANKINKLKIFKVIILILISLIFSILILKVNTFSKSFNFIADINMSAGIGLIGLIIGGFSIVIASLSNESVYCLILDRSMNSKFSTYKSTILYCLETLFWFCLLLLITFVLKLAYLFYPTISYLHFPTTSIKILILTLLILLMLTSLISLIYFIFNIYNIILSNARFEVLKRYAKANSSNIEKIIEQLEKDYNEQQKECK